MKIGCLSHDELCEIQEAVTLITETVDFYELKYEDVAVMLGISLDTAKAVLRDWQSPPAGESLLQSTLPFASGPQERE